MTPNLSLPEGFAENVYRVFGADGQAWLQDLPQIAAECRRRWQLKPGSPCASMSMNYIEFCTTAQDEAVALKIGPPHGDLFTEMEALALYNGRGAVRFFNADRELGAILMQRLHPGHMLTTLSSNIEQTEIASRVMQNLWQSVPPEHQLPHFTRWTQRAFHLTRTSWDPEARMPRDLINHAEAALDELLATSEPVLLHGDLHHENILFDAERGWLAIDPKGVIGPACLEVGRFLQNQLPFSLADETRRTMLLERITIFSRELNVPRRMLAAAGLVDCVLSKCWYFEEQGDLDPGWERELLIAQWLLPVWQNA